jgi:hypothetical protein
LSIFFVLNISESEKRKVENLSKVLYVFCHIGKESAEEKEEEYEEEEDWWLLD